MVVYRNASYLFCYAFCMPFYFLFQYTKMYKGCVKLFIKCFSASPQELEPCLLPEVTAHDQGKICVVIDLDETLVHSSFKVPDTA